jgi:hypothetical protein
MTEIAFLVALAAACVVCAFRPPLAFALVVLLFPIEQVVQAHAPRLISSALGIQSVNYAIGLTALCAALKVTLTRPGGASRWMNAATVSALVMLAWAAITLLWSPGRTDGLQMVAGNWPYLVLLVVLAPVLLTDVEDLRTSVQALLVLGMILCAAVVLSPEFTSKYGRLGFSIASGVRSNPLAIGELGGVVLLVAATIRGTTLLGVPLLPLRVAAALLGVLVAIKSGSRGQLLFAVMVSILFVPVATPVRNVGAFISSAIIIAITLFVVDFVISNQLQSYEAQRFSGESVLYGDSSAFGRVRNVTAMAGEWIRNPVAIVVGLGYSAFSQLPAAAGQPYSHVIFADAVFELGLPGLACLAIGLAVSASSAVRLWRAHAEDRTLRASVAVLVGLLAYQILLVNKQGAIWGVPMFFTFEAVVARLWLRERDAMQLAQEDQPDEDAESDDAYAVTS